MSKHYLHSLLFLSLISGYLVAMENQNEQSPAATDQNGKRKHVSEKNDKQLPPKKQQRKLSESQATAEKELEIETPTRSNQDRQNYERAKVIAMYELVLVDENILKKSLLEVINNYPDEIVSKFISQFDGDFDEQDTQGMTVLYKATEANKEPLVNALATYGADVNRGDANGFTPLHVAINKNYLLIAKCLLEHNAAVNKQTNEGITPLHLAIMNKDLALISLLLDANADMHAIDSKNNTPLSLVFKSADVSLLLLFGPKLIQ